MTMYHFLTRLLGPGVFCQPDGVFIVLADGGRGGIEAHGYSSSKSPRLAQAVEALL